MATKKTAYFHGMEVYPFGKVLNKIWVKYANRVTGLAIYDVDGSHGSWFFLRTNYQDEKTFKYGDGDGDPLNITIENPNGEKFVVLHKAAYNFIKRNYPCLIPFYDAGIRRFDVKPRKRLYADQKPWYKQPWSTGNGCFRDEFNLFWTLNFEKLSRIKTVFAQIGNASVMEHFRGQEDESVTLYFGEGVSDGK